MVEDGTAVAARDEEEAAGEEAAEDRRGHAQEEARRLMTPRGEKRRLLQRTLDGSGGGGAAGWDWMEREQATVVAVVSCRGKQPEHGGVLLVRKCCSTGHQGPSIAAAHHSTASPG